MPESSAGGDRRSGFRTPRARYPCARFGSDQEAGGAQIDRRSRRRCTRRDRKADGSNGERIVKRIPFDRGPVGICATVLPAAIRLPERCARVTRPALARALRAAGFKLRYGAGDAPGRWSRADDGLRRRRCSGRFAAAAANRELGAAAAGAPHLGGATRCRARDGRRPVPGQQRRRHRHQDDPGAACEHTRSGHGPLTNTNRVEHPHELSIRNPSTQGKPSSPTLGPRLPSITAVVPRCQASGANAGRLVLIVPSRRNRFGRGGLTTFPPTRLAYLE
jgi:hypothetical protein